MPAEPAAPRAPDPLEPLAAQLARVVAERDSAAAAIAPPAVRPDGPVLARTMTEAVPVLKTFVDEHGTTFAAFKALYDALSKAHGELKGDETQWSFLGEEEREELRQAILDAQAGARTLRSAIKSHDVDANPMTFDLKTGPTGVKTAAKTFQDHLFTIRRILNGAFRAHGKHVAEQLEKQRLIEESRVDYSQYEEEITYETGTGGAIETIVGEEGGLEFPHKGKHRPPPGAVDNWEKLKEVTGEKGAVALYRTANARTVLAWEATARTEGLPIMKGSTIIYGFDEDIGCDHGESTPYIRIDGDHGHPIMSSGLKTSFNGYVKRAVEEAKNPRDDVRLLEIKAFLEKIHVPTGPYKLGV